MLKRNSLVTLLSALVIVGLLAGGQAIGLLKPLNELLAGAVAPLARVGYSLGNLFKQDVYNGQSASHLSDALSKVTAENHELLNQNAQLAEVQRENDDLKKILNYQQTSGREVHAARIIARGPAEGTTHQQTIILDQGRNAGLTTGAPIVDTEGILVGKVMEVKDSISEGCLLFKDSCRLAVTIQGQAGTVGVIQSDLSLALKIDFIPHDIQISQGQMIVTSGLESGMPAGLVVGRVSQVIKEGNELWQHALVEPLGSFATLRTVAVIK